MLARSLALAKINLHLHITGRADNGYHHLDSLVAFTSLGDDIQIKPSDKFQLNISGNMTLASTCSEQDNLISRVTHLLAQQLGIPPNVQIDLFKRIPLAGGLGGGSADAATTLLLLKEIWNIPSNDALETVAASLGSDITACLYNKPVVMRETGNKIVPAPVMPTLYGILANPNVSCPTPDVYKTYAQSKAAFSNDIQFPDNFESITNVCEFLKEHTRNDLTDAAINVAPQIKPTLDMLDQLPNCRLARLSGSGATCFAIFENPDHRDAAYTQMMKHAPHLWAECVDINQP